MAVQLETNYLNDLRRIVEGCVDTSVWRPVIFGSRASGKARKFSDIDLGFIGDKPLPQSTKMRLWEALDDSDIPYVVDIVDLANTQADFKAVATQHIENL
ncbi:MAG: nucleotidyltransferase domain-containing protein [Candidatus Saccharimonadales bacterium]